MRARTGRSVLVRFWCRRFAELSILTLQGSGPRCPPSPRLGVLSRAHLLLGFRRHQHLLSQEESPTGLAKSQIPYPAQSRRSCWCALLLTPRGSGAASPRVSCMNCYLLSPQAELGKSQDVGGIKFFIDFEASKGNYVVSAPSMCSLARVSCHSWLPDVDLRTAAASFRAFPLATWGRERDKQTCIDRASPTAG